MTGSVALHGGGEFLAGDEAFLSALLSMAAGRVGRVRPIRVAVVPTAAARGRPHLAGRHGVQAFERVAAAGGLEIEAEVVPVVDPGSAAQPGLVRSLDVADIIHLPGGDPDLVPTILSGSAAWAAIASARAAGAILAGASAGAMALATWTWTPAGGIAGLGLVPGLVVVPHADGPRWASLLERFGAGVPAGLGALGLPERTGVIAGDLTADPVRWTVVGEGTVRWMATLGGGTIVAHPGDTLETPARSLDGPSS